MTEISQAQNAPQKENTAFMAKLSLGLVCLFFLVFIWFAINQNQHFNEIEKTLSKKLEQTQALNQQSLAVAKQADERSIKTHAKTMVIEEKLAQSQDQQEVLQTLYNQLAEDREMTAVVEVEQLVTIANQQLKLSGNVKSALLALQAADHHLEPLNLPRATLLRQTLGNEIQNLRQLPQFDPILITAQIESLTTLCANLPLMSEHQPAIKQKIAQNQYLKTTHLGKMQRFFYQIWSDIKNLVTVERIDKPTPPLLSTEHQFYLRENLKLRLLSARIALLQRDEISYQADLNAVKSWLNQYYDIQHPNALKALSLLNKLIESKVNLALPDLNESLTAINRYKLSLEAQR